jgi:hypothetical protein
MDTPGHDQASHANSDEAMEVENQITGDKDTSVSQVCVGVRFVFAGVCIASDPSPVFRSIFSWPGDL